MTEKITKLEFDELIKEAKSCTVIKDVCVRYRLEDNTVLLNCFGNYFKKEKKNVEGRNF